MDVGAGALDGPWGGGDLGFDNPSVSCADSSLYTREPGAYGIRWPVGEFVRGVVGAAPYREVTIPGGEGQ